MARRIAALAAGCLLLPAVLLAQDTPGAPDVSKVRIRLGALYLNPTLRLTNVGIDDNVFNEPEQALPKSDFTMTATPAVDLWLRMGPTWLSGAVREDLVYYKKYASERSTNQSYKANWFVPLNRLVVNAGGELLNTRERPGFEIDARAERREYNYTGSVEIRAFSKTYFGVRGAQRTTTFDEGATFRGVDLANELDRTSTGAGATVRFQLTPLTSLNFEVAQSQDRFDRSPLRDSDSTLVDGGVKFEPFALVSGSATVGYRDFRPANPAVPGYTGSIAAVDLTYTALGSTRFGLKVNRDVQYSYDITQPYYVQTGIDASGAQQIFGPIDAEARIGAARLVYQTAVGTGAAPGRSDHVRAYGAGVGYRFSESFRVGANIDRQHRTSPIAADQYDGTRIGLSLTYSF